MKRLLLLIITTWAVSSQFGYCQSPPDTVAVGYIRIQLSDLTTSEQAESIDELIRSKNGVMMSRSDRSTDTYLGYYLVSSGLTQNDFLQWIHSLGFGTGCVVTGIRDGSPLKDFPKECDYVTRENRTN